MGIKAATYIWLVRIFIDILVFGWQKLVLSVNLVCVLYSVQLEVTLFTCTSILQFVNS